MRHKLNLDARSTAVRRASLCTLLTAVCMALGTGASYGQATTGAFEFEEPFSDTITNYLCSGGDPVTMTGTMVTKGHSTETDPNHFSRRWPAMPGSLESRHRCRQWRSRCSLHQLWVVPRDRRARWRVSMPEFQPRTSYIRKPL